MLKESLVTTANSKICSSLSNPEKPSAWLTNPEGGQDAIDAAPVILSTAQLPTEEQDTEYSRMADSSDKEIRSWSMACQANTDDFSSSGTIQHEQQSSQGTFEGAGARHSWSNPPSNSSNAAGSANAWHDRPASTGSGSLSLSLCTSSVAGDGTCWNPSSASSSQTGLAHMDGSSPTLWADCSADAAFGMPKQQQTDTTSSNDGSVNVAAHILQEGQSFPNGLVVDAGSADGDRVLFHADSRQSPSDASGSEPHLGMYPSTVPNGWVSSKSNVIRSSCKVSGIAGDNSDEALQQQIQKAINSTESWGRTPIRQDTPWIESGAVDVKAKVDSNTWSAQPNNGTALWETSRSIRSDVNGHLAVPWEERRGAAVNEKLNTWAASSIGKDGTSWVDLGNKDSTSIDGQSDWLGSSTAGLDLSWNDGAGRGRSRLSALNVSQPDRSMMAASNVETRVGSSGQIGSLMNGEGSRGNSPPSIGSSVPGGASDWNATMSRMPPRSSDSKLSQGSWVEGAQHGWNHDLQQSGSSMGPVARQQSQPLGRADFSGAAMPWDQPSAGRSNSIISLGSGPVSGSTEWEANSSGGPGNTAWSSSDMPGVQRASRQGSMQSRDDASTSEWAGSAVGGPPRRARYSLDSAMPVGWRSDADIGEWSGEQNRREWLAASGPRRGIPPNKQGASHGMSMKSSTGSSFAQPPPTRQQMMQTLLDMGFSKENAQKALIDNNMDLNLALADLRRFGANQQGLIQPSPRALLPSSAVLASQDAGGFTSAPYHMYPGSTNTHMNSAQAATIAGAKSFMQIPSSRQQYPASIAPQLPKVVRQLHNNQHSPVGPVWAPNTTHNQVTQNLHCLVSCGLIPASALKQTNVAIIEQMLKLFTTYQSLSSQMIPPMAGRGSMGPQQAAEHSQLELMRKRLVMLSQVLQQQQPQQQPPHHVLHQQPDAALLAELSNLALGPPPAPSYVPPPQAQSKLSQWKVACETETSGTLGQANRAPGAKPSSVSSAGLQGPGGDDCWPASALGFSRPKLDANHNESQPPDDFHIPEFIPGKMWSGSSNQMTADDPSSNSSNSFYAGKGDDEIWSMYSSLPRSMSMPSGSSWSTAAAAPAAASSAAATSSPVSDGVWSASHIATPRSAAAPARPPPGLLNSGGSSKNTVGSGYGRRSSTTAAPGSMWESSSQWLMLRNVAPHMDHGRLKALCGQHGSVSAFFMNLHLGVALVQYNYAQDAANAQSNLNSCVLANSTVSAELVGDEEARTFLDQNAPSSLSPAGHLNSLPQWSTGISPVGHQPSAAASLWNGGGAGGSGLPSSAGLGGFIGNLWAGVPGVDGSSNSFLPDLLSTSDYTM